MSLPRPRPRPRAAAFALVLALAAGPLAAQAPRPAVRAPAAAAAPAAPPAAAEPGSDITVQVLTMGPGTEVWELFGHNALWLRDPSRGIDLAYNWGMFSFEQENFFLNFARGRMRYWMLGIDAGETIAYYAKAGRAVWAQELELTPAEKVALRDALLANDTDANRFYRYDYYRDNCSTRVRDAIDRVTGGQLRAFTDTIATRTTYRSFTREITASEVPVYFGIQALLGRQVDRPLTAWEQMFLPFQLRARLAQARRVLPDGRTVPLVRVSRELAPQRLVVETRDHVPGGAWTFLGAGLVLALAIAGLLARAPAVSRAAASAWGIVSGLGGVVLAGLWLFTDHVVASANENVLLLSVFALPLGVLLWRRDAGGAVGRALALLVAAGVGIACLLVFGAGHQQNGEVLAFTAPLDLALALVAARLARLGAVRAA